MKINKNEHFSPLFIAGLFTKSLPKTPMNILIGRICDKMVNNHPSIFERLSEIEEKCFLICPTDLPHNISLTIGNMNIDARIDDGLQINNDVIIKGSLLSLLAMLDGKEDGDALFFKRRIIIEGDTEALLTLRNAMDSEDINLKEELLDNFGILKSPLNSLLQKSDKYYQNIADDFDKINDAITRPLNLKFNILRDENIFLREKLLKLDKKLQKTINKVQKISNKAKL